MGQLLLVQIRGSRWRQEPQAWARDVRPERALQSLKAQWSDTPRDFSWPYAEREGAAGGQGFTRALKSEWAVGLVLIVVSASITGLTAHNSGNQWAGVLGWIIIAVLTTLISVCLSVNDDYVQGRLRRMRVMNRSKVLQQRAESQSARWAPFVGRTLLVSASAEVSARSSACGRGPAGGYGCASPSVE